MKRVPGGTPTLSTEETYNVAALTVTVQP